MVNVIAVPNLEKLGYATTALIGLQTGPGKLGAMKLQYQYLKRYLGHRTWLNKNTQ